MALHFFNARNRASVDGKEAYGALLTAERQPKKKPFANWVKRITSLKNNDDADGSKKKRAAKHKKSNTLNGTFKNNPYPESGALQQHGHSPASSANGALSFATPPSRPRDDDGGYSSVDCDQLGEREDQFHSNRSGAPTLATNAGTIHSDAGHSKAATATTGAGALSSNDGAGGAGSTFSSPAPSERSMTTTLTTIQSQAPANALHNGASGGQHHHGMLNNPNHPVQFSHQYPTSPAPSAMTAASAIPRHISEAIPTTYNSATANNLLTDNASILTLASSSKQRRRRSMDTDASVRAIPPSSVWGGSRESLPLSVLSGNADGYAGGQAGLYAPSRPSISGLASAERASVYSSQGIAAPALASERNSFYSHKPTKDLGDGKSLRSITNIDARSQYDARSINADAKSQLGDVASLKNYEGSVRSGMLGGHGRNDSIPGSIGSPLTSPGIRRQASASGALSRRSSDWPDEEEERRDGSAERADHGE